MRRTIHGESIIQVLSNFGYLAPRLNKTRGEACAHFIDVGFNGEKQLRMSHPPAIPKAGGRRCIAERVKI